MPQLTAIQVDVDNNAHCNYYNRELVMYEQMFFFYELAQINSGVV